MAGKSAGFAIGIGIQDGASAGLDAINKRIAAMTAPAERFNKSLAKFGDVTGINRAAEGMQTLGDRALGAARSIERMAGPMASITSLASIGGMVELSRRWAEAGNQISKTAYQLNTPVDKLGALRGAARLAGSSADAMDSSLKGLGDTLATAKFKGGAMVPLLNELHIGFQGVGNEARTGADALGDVAEAVSKYKDPHAQVHLLEQLGISSDLLPLLQNGWNGLEEFRAKALQTGGVMTGEMAANAKKMNSSWVELGLAIEGVGNRIVDSWSGTATKVLDATSHWIENNKALADSYAEIGGGIVALGLLKPAAWLLRLLGLGAVNTLAAPVVLPLSLGGDTPGGSGDYGREAAQAKGGKDWDDWQQAHPNPFTWGWNQIKQSWSGGSASAPPGPISVPRPPSAAAATMLHAHDYFRTKGMTEEQTAGILSNIAAESGFDPTRSGDNGTSYGLFQHHASRLAAMQSRYHTATPNEDQQLDFAWDELKTGYKGVLETMNLDPHNAKTSGSVFSAGFEGPKDARGEALRRGDGADQFLPHPGGTVQVDVTLRGAPPGTTARVSTTGAASAGAPRVETSMPMAR